ncbi:hypothetical protein BDY17DRAFT_322673 [Neohortaea acidophila]|uniref:Uncharacterized protein n=1 Tax=Neohortaea acidophila TaxID=245834 RepID=A0A6A6Q1K0_9PEZI|nr:uncharacterized protein BDY17DRAFT_322673 [Neohortaea acidophila]KAF2485866.1 hypothetical protein BDY17DRAFT_322673 [Neohortaea acidophila]
MAQNKPETTDAHSKSFNPTAASTSFTDYKEEATFPTERPSGKMLKSTRNPRAPWNESFVMVERPRSPTPPVMIDTEGNEVEEEAESPGSIKKKGKKQAAADKTVRFASTNDVRQLHDGPQGDAGDDENKEDGVLASEGRMFIGRNGACVVFIPAGWKPPKDDGGWDLKQRKRSSGAGIKAKDESGGEA